MSATQPIGLDRDRDSGEYAIKHQLEALANGEFDHVAFLEAMKERFRSEPDENWEVLSLLDQYHRRGKIPADVHRTIKNGFAEFILGPQVVTPTLFTVATPAPAPSASSSPPSQASAASKASAGAGREVHIDDVVRDRYRVEAMVARGASGTVFEVSDAYRLNLPPTAKRLAMKVPRAPDPRGHFSNQLRHEFHQLQLLSHPNIVRAFDFDRDGALSFLTMELLNGVHLPQVLQAKAGQPLPRAHALAIIRDVGSALAYAHARGVVHGDVNPQNIFITMAGEVRLLGFGAAHKLSAAAPAPEFERDSAASDTHRYASCEVLEGTRPTVQDDIYSLSCLACLLLAGKHPYADATAIEVRAGRLRPRRPGGLDYQQWRTLRRGLSTDPNKRPDGVQQWLDAMALRGAAPHLPAASELIEARAGQQRGWQLLAAAALIAALAGAGYWFSTGGGAPSRAPNGTTNGTPTAAPTASDASESPDSNPNVTAPQAPTSSGAPMATAPPAGTKATGAVPAVSAPSTARPSIATPSTATQTIAMPPRHPPAVAPKRVAAAPAASRTTGTARLEMAAGTLDVSPADTAVHVTVRRKGNLHGDTSFTWWTESGTAKPGVDFSPVLPHVAHMQDGEASTVLTVPLIPTPRGQPKGFYVGIESTEGGAQVGARSLTQITLPATN
jgi:serine/threonine protein kinase